MVQVEWGEWGDARPSRTDERAEEGGSPRMRFWDLAGRDV